MRYKLILLLLLVQLTVVAQDHTRVISLAPSITENVYLVGGKNKLVGCTSYCTQAVNDGVNRIGSTIDVNVEKILALQPDVVLTMKLTKAQDIAAMRKLGLDVVVMETPMSFDEICEQNQQIAQLIGCRDGGEKVVASARKRVDEIREMAKKLPPRKIFFQIGANPIFSVLDGTYMNDFITFCNGKNIASGLKHGTLTRESVVLKNPDLIIIAEMGGFGQQELDLWNSFKGVSAVKQNKVFLISSETSCSPTPANFVQALEDVFSFISE
ncbi:helical backbone metal receptor [uncultured Draconibacterium sp.]|uniref:ABC transporter substrate-binding protein n=1 Tax=uncultured Draconibacterium sp. TaxID=1573823 RepID=UPI003260A391